jgi:hypothetical protein
MMLAYVERRVSLDPHFIFQDNKSLRLLLRDAERSAVDLSLDNALREQMTDALSRYSERSESFDLTGATMENEAYQEILTHLIKAFAELRTEAGNPARDSFRSALHRYLHELGERDLHWVEKALKHVPV